MRSVSDNSSGENKIKKIYVRYFVSENRAVYDNVEKYCRAGQATDDNMAHAYFTLGT